MGILAAVAIFIVRKQIEAARSGEAKAVIAGIRGAQHVYRQEHLAYANCSATLTSYYPHATPDAKKYNFDNPGHTESACWTRLGIKTDGPVRYVYSVVAGAGNTALPAIPDFTAQPTWPSSVGPREPWFVVHAAGDLDGDGQRSSFWSSSFSNEVGVEREEE